MAEKKGRREGAKPSPRRTTMVSRRNSDRKSAPRLRSLPQKNQTPTQKNSRSTMTRVGVAQILAVENPGEFCPQAVKATVANHDQGHGQDLGQGHGLGQGQSQDQGPGQAHDPGHAQDQDREAGQDRVQDQDQDQVQDQDHVPSLAAGRDLVPDPKAGPDQDPDLEVDRSLVLGADRGRRLDREVDRQDLEDRDHQDQAEGHQDQIDLGHHQDRPGQEDLGRLQDPPALAVVAIKADIQHVHILHFKMIYISCYTKMFCADKFS